MTKNIAVFPGSFDPFTVGHESVVKRALSIFDKIIIGIGVNQTKSKFLSTETRVNLIKKVFKDEPKVEVKIYSGLTVNFCQQENSNYILRGLRTSSDFEFERAVGQTNKLLESGIETVFLLCLPEHSFISSSIVRDVIINGGRVDEMLPTNITIKDIKY